MKVRLVPLYFDPGRDEDFDKQLAALDLLLGEQVELLDPVPLGAALPEAEAVVFPQILGQAYQQLAALQAIDLPILIVTSEFGTLAMWDWEIVEYLRSNGVATIAPYSPEQTQQTIAALAVKRELQETKFLVFQDDPGEGFQASIFKRFYWWEEECTQRLMEKFGIEIVKRSFRELGAEAKAIPDVEADEVGQRFTLPRPGLSDQAYRGAVKLYMALKRYLAEDNAFGAAGINCLNESHFSETTPCLAWNLLYQETGLIWGCEADTMSMVTKFMLHKSLRAPIIMTNLYPFLLGDAALKHERIDAFPEVGAEPENHILVAHCGYMGVIPESFATEWALKEKVLAIVDDNASAIDARLPTGDITLAKLHPMMDKLTAVAGELKGYAQFPGSDCLNGGVIKVNDGRRLMESVASHHYLLLVGNHVENIRLIARVFDLDVLSI